MFDKAAETLISQGLLGVLLLFAIYAIVKLFNRIMEMQKESVEIQKTLIDTLNRHATSTENLEKKVATLVETVQTAKQQSPGVSEKLLEALALRGITRS